MKCSQCQEMFAAQIEGLLDGDLSSRFEAHLAACAACRTELDETRRLFDRLTKDGRRASTPSISSTVMERVLQRKVDQMSRGNRLKSVARIAIAVALFFGVSIGVFQLVFSPNRGIASAEELAAVARQIEKARTITWKTTFYNEVVSKDGKRAWIETKTREFAYKAPGLYLDTDRDENGRITNMTITDNVRLKRLSLNHATKEAILRELAFPAHDVNGPFQSVTGQGVGTTEWVATQKIGGREVNIFRNVRKDVDVPSRFEYGKRDWSTDYWIDAKTKRLVRIQVPGVDIYDPEKDPKRESLSETEWSRMVGLYFVHHDIAFDVELDESTFSLDPPAGYALKSELRPQVTEEEMIEYLGVLAEYFDNSFPDRVLPHAISSSDMNRIYDKPEKERSAAEKKILEKAHYYVMAHLNLFPIRHFLRDHAVDGTWKYLGKGVKLSDKDRIVCWYRLKGSKTYRVVYGDLSVRDVAAQDLPLPVEQ